VGALAGRSPEHGFTQFDALIRKGHRAHEFLFPFGFMQIKKVGGSGESKGDEIEAHARKYSDVLRQQLVLYEPHVVIACGLGDRSPARLLRKHVLTRAADERSTVNEYTCWHYAEAARPRALLQFKHPSSRRSRSELYCALAAAVADVVTEVGL